MNCFAPSLHPLARQGVLLIMLGVAGAAMAQLDDQPAASPTPGSIQRGIWEADMPGGAYIVRLASITSVSMHEYLVDAAARVTEVNIGTTGTELVRFYYIEPNIPKAPDGVGQGLMNVAKEKAENVAERVAPDNDVWRKVIKNYPMTTHARTIEYRVASKESLQKLFDSIKQAWLRDSGGVFKP